MLKKMVKTPVCILVLMILLFGCTPEISNVSRIDTIQSLLLDPNCTLPCWAGIQVEFSEFDEAENILQDRYGFDNVTVENNYLEWSNGNNPFDGLKAGSILFADDKVSEIYLVFDEKSNFLVKDLIEILGEPNWVNVIWSGPNPPCLGVELQYPKKGVLVILDTANAFKGVAEDQLVSILLFRSIPDADKWEISDSTVVKWIGFHDYCQS